MNKKTILVLLLVISAIMAACGQKVQEQPAAQEAAAADQPVDLGEGLSDAGTLGDDLNVDDTSSDTDAALNEIQTI